MVFKVTHSKASGGEDWFDGIGEEKGYYPSRSKVRNLSCMYMKLFSFHVGIGRVNFWEM